AERRRLRGIAVVTGVVVAPCWLQPVVEQFTSDGQGNLSRVASGASGSSEKVGPSLAVRMVANVVAVPPWWMRPSFGDAFLHTGTASTPAAQEIAGLPSMGLALAALALLAVVLALCGRTARRRGDEVTF